ncbi:S-adenosyl-L-methionine-dependent methyltransferase [Mycena amicta]|nr:S-adenosyl-L-methionine-dependent methyltransferase [Mycena amicta]
MYLTCANLSVFDSELCAIIQTCGQWYQTKIDRSQMKNVAIRSHIDGSSVAIREPESSSAELAGRAPSPGAYNSMEPLRQLVALISASLDTMEEAFARSSVPVPTLGTIYDSSSAAEAVRTDPEVATAVLNIVAAAGQLTAAVRSPENALLHAAQGFHISSCLRSASELNVSELLRDAGPQGLHANDIAARCNTDGALLARILRLLASHHIFTEVAPDTFANNRISSALDKGKPYQELLANREDRLVGSTGIAAYIEAVSEDMFKTSAYLSDTLISPVQGQLPFNRAFGTDVPFYTWLFLSENSSHRRRFELGMQAIDKPQIKDAIFLGFNWGNLPLGSTLVDVGGGNGHLSLQISQRYQGIKVVVQDLEHTLQGGRLLWKTNFPEYIEKGLVDFQVQDFFTPQPASITSCSSPVMIFLLRFILHNWNDQKAIEILTHLSAAAKARKQHNREASTKIVIVETLITLATRNVGDKHEYEDHKKPEVAPQPLLPNWGVAGAQGYCLDMTVHNILGASERTLEGYCSILRQAGWMLDRVYHCGPGAGSELSHIVAIPV